MSCLKCLVCGIGIHTKNPHNNNDHNDCSQLFTTVCYFLNLDSDLPNLTNNSPLITSNVFCDHCQVTAVKLLDLQNSLLEIETAIQTTIATITKTIVQTETQQEQQQNPEQKRRNITRVPCEDESGQFMEVEIKEENLDECEEEEGKENKDSVKLISDLRKIVYKRFSPVIKVAPVPVPVDIKPIENIIEDTTEIENVPTRRSSRRAVKKRKLEEYVSPTEDDDEEDNEEFFDDNFNDDDGDDDFDPSEKPKNVKKKETETKADPDYELPVNFNEDDYAFTKVIWETPADGSAPQSKEVTRWKCPNCTSSFSRGNDLKRHFSKYHGPDAIIERKTKLLSKPVPGKPGCFIYAKKWEYEIKEDTETGKIITCLTCGLQRKNLETVKRHIDRDHNFTRRWPCIKCGKSYVSQNFFKSHNCVPKERKKPHQVKEMPDGSFLFAEKYSFVKIDDEADVDGTGFQFQCSVCNAIRKAYLVMVNHMRTHDQKSKRFLCSECGKGFLDKRNLATHIEAVHDSELNYSCEICGRLCKTKNSLYSHKKRAHSEATFKCATEGCDKIYTTKESLVLHCRRNSHSLGNLRSWKEQQKKSVSCSRCGSDFRNSRALQVHENFCNGVKKKQRKTKIYSCRECAKPFFSFARCKEHEFSHNQEKLLSLSSTATTTTTNTIESMESEAQNTTEEMKSATNEQTSERNENEQSLSLESNQDFSPQMFSLQDNTFTSILDNISEEK